MKIKYPISLKQILLFSFLIILVLGGSTALVSTLVHADDRIKAEENNLALNGRTAQTVQSAFKNIQSNSYMLFEAFAAVKGTSQKKELSEAFFRSNQDILFVFSPETQLLLNPAVSESEDRIKAFLDSAEPAAFIADTSPNKKTLYCNASDVFNFPAVVFIYKYGPANSVKNGAVGLNAGSLAELMATGNAVVIYESPFRIVKLLTDIADIESNRRIVVGRELTKLHEEITSGTAKELLEDYASRQSIKGEFAIFISGVKNAKYSEESADN